MKAVGRNLNSYGHADEDYPDAVVWLASSPSFQLTYNILRDDNDETIATYVGAGNPMAQGRDYWVTPNGIDFTDITIEEDMIVTPTKMEKIWVCELDGSEFTEHLLSPTSIDERTICGITYDSLPVSPESLFEPEKNWFSDHDRNDVVKCVYCFSTTMW